MGQGSGSASDKAQQVARQLPTWAKTLGFSQIGIADVDLSAAEPGLKAWLDAGFHGRMAYMAAHGRKRARPAELVPGTLRVITARMDYLPRATPPDWQAVEWRRLAEPARATVSIYARGRDYHKVLRQRLKALADRITEAIGPFGFRVFTDSAPVLEVELAERSGLGWRGKHTLALTREAGSTFFLGEIFVDLPLPLTEAVSPHCGTCTACIQVCPTQAIVAPYLLDARRCVSYLTIEHDGPIPEALRPLVGNRIYGCDDCQLACPWNKFAQAAVLADFDARSPWGQVTLHELWRWDAPTFLARTEGSPMRRIGFERWRRNLAVAIGNALRAEPSSGSTQLADEQPGLRAALGEAMTAASPLVQEHIAWALKAPERPPAGPGPAAHRPCRSGSTG